MMSTRRIRLSLWLLSGLILIGGGAGMVWGLRISTELDTLKVRSPEPELEKGIDPERDQIPNNAQMQSLAKTSLRTRLFDPPPKPKPVKRKPPPKPLPQFTLIGTLSGSSPRAMLRIGRGTQLKRVGDVLGQDNNSAKILEIQQNLIVVEHEGKRVEVKVDKGGRRR